MWISSPSSLPYFWKLKVSILMATFWLVSKKPMSLFNTFALMINFSSLGIIEISCSLAFMAEPCVLTRSFPT